MAKTVKTVSLERFKEVAFAFLDVTDGMKTHDFFAHMGGTPERAAEVAIIRDELFKLVGREWLASEAK